MSTDLYHDTCHHKIYRLTCDQFDALRAYAEGKCQICGLPEAEAKRGRLVIDHMGDYGWHAVRGLFCDRCNMLMRRVDASEDKCPPVEVYDYRANAWFARMTNPDGPTFKWVTARRAYHTSVHDLYANT